MNKERVLIIDKPKRVKDREENSYAVSRLKEELSKKKIRHEAILTTDIEHNFINGGWELIANGTNLREYTHVILRGHDLHDARSYERKLMIIDYCERNDIVLLNKDAYKKIKFYNKIYIAQFCVENSIPYFDTYYRTDGDYLNNLDKVPFDFPMILKEYGGANRIVDNKVKKNVFKIDNKDELAKLESELGSFRNYFLQEFSDKGEDFRIFLSEGNVVGGWKRSSNDSFMTVSKGVYENYDSLSKEEKKFCERVAEVIEADFIAVDFMYSSNNILRLQEFSLHPGFKAYETKVSGHRINLAKIIVESVV